MNILFRFLGSFRRPTPLEAAVLGGLAEILPPTMSATFSHQAKRARIKRCQSGQTVEFFHSSPIPLEQLASVPNAVLGTATVRGKISGFGSTATVRMAFGILASLEFSTMPWPGHEPLEVLCRLADFPIEPV